MTACLRDFLDADVEAVLRIDAGLLGKDERCKSRPPRDSNGYFGTLRDRGSHHEHDGDRSCDDFGRGHVALRFRKFGGVDASTGIARSQMYKQRVTGARRWRSAIWRHHRRLIT